MEATKDGISFAIAVVGLLVILVARGPTDTSFGYSSAAFAIVLCGILAVAILVKGKLDDMSAADKAIAAGLCVALAFIFSQLWIGDGSYAMDTGALLFLCGFLPPVIIEQATSVDAKLAAVRNRWRNRPANEH